MNILDFKNRGGFSLPPPPLKFLVHDSLLKFKHVIIENKLY